MIYPDIYYNYYNSLYDNDNNLNIIDFYEKNYNKLEELSKENTFYKCIFYLLAEYSQSDNGLLEYIKNFISHHIQYQLSKSYHDKYVLYQFMLTDVDMINYSIQISKSLLNRIEDSDINNIYNDIIISYNILLYGLDSDKSINDNINVNLFNKDSLLNKEILDKELERIHNNLKEVNNNGGKI